MADSFFNVNVDVNAVCEACDEFIETEGVANTQTRDVVWECVECGAENWMEW